MKLEELLQQSNELGHFVENEVAGLDETTLTKKPNEKTWSIIEVVDHLNKVYDQYLDNFEDAIASAPELEGESNEHKQSILGRMGIYSMRPKGRKRRFKMKTFDFFEPGNDNGQIAETLEAFKSNKNRFNDLIKLARTREVIRKKMPTAMGPRFKMYVGECFEFVLAHEQRHVVQISNILEAQGIKV